MASLINHVVNNMLDSSQLSAFSYFYSIVERADRIARELDASAKERLDRVGGGDREKYSSCSLRSHTPQIHLACFSFQGPCINRKVVNSLGTCYCNGASFF